MVISITYCAMAATYKNQNQKLPCLLFFLADNVNCGSCCESFFQIGGIAKAMERFLNYGDEVAGFRTSVRARDWIQIIFMLPLANSIALQDFNWSLYLFVI